MNSKEPKKTTPHPMPHDPRNEPLPQRKEPNPTKEEAEKKVREEEGLAMERAAETLLAGPVEANEEQEPASSLEEGMPTGIQTGQTSRGSYSTDPATGGGRYADHRAGTFGKDDVAQPGNDQEVEPDQVDPKI